MKKNITLISIVFLLVALVSCNNSSENDTSNNQNVLSVSESTHDADNYKLDDSLSYMEMITEKDDVFKIKFVVGNFKVKEDRLLSGKMFLDMKSVDPEAKPINKAFIAKEYMNVKYFPQAVLNIIKVEEFNDKKPLFGFRPTHKVTALLMFKGVSKQIFIPVKIKISDGELKMSSPEIDFKGSKWNIGTDRNKMLENTKIQLDVLAFKK
ncbi:MAG: YceI family protein [Bacteroidales bacterium]|nr:YceI family protein [Bacteroidales bacterium]